ncbi:DNA-binding protein [Cryobacterium sp. TMT4-10]|nr:DNA-binding protein [Cryobacterium sp. TMT4-10]
MTSSLGALPKVGAPATRALQAARYIELRQLAGLRRSDLAALHGIGPKALGILEAALKEHAFSLS